MAIHARVRRAPREFLRCSQEAAREAGVTPEQHHLPLAISVPAQGWLLVGDTAHDLMIAARSAAGSFARARTAWSPSRRTPRTAGASGDR